MTWRNRIVKYGEADPEQLLAHPYNWRVHPAFQQDALQGALEEIGWLAEVIVNLRTSEEWPPGERGVETLLDGHLRVKLALRRDQEQIPVKYVDLSPQEEALALATFDPLSAMAVADAEALDALLEAVEAENPALQRMITDLKALAAAEMKRIRDLPEGEASQEEMITLAVTAPDSVAAEVMAVLDTFKSRGLKWKRME